MFGARSAILHIYFNLTKVLHTLYVPQYQGLPSYCWYSFQVWELQLFTKFDIPSIFLGGLPSYCWHSVQVWGIIQPYLLMSDISSMCERLPSYCWHTCSFQVWGITQHYSLTFDIPSMCGGCCLNFILGSFNLTNVWHVLPC